MKNICRIDKFGLAILSAAATLLAGCVTYVQSPPPPQPVVAEVVLPQPEPVPDYGDASAGPAVMVIHTESDFYEPLNPYGRWVVIEGYGRCWTPANVDRDWRPYCSGHWQRTDAGWYWVSDEQWGWATYHYGRWRMDMSYGWVWVPQTMWAPAWVCWRDGGGYTGWAPLPPEARFGARGDFNFRAEAIEPRAFVFVEQRRLLEPHRPQTVIINNTTIINNTVNITKIQVVNKTVVNEGPRPEIIERASGRKVNVLPMGQVRAAQEAKVFAAQHKSPAVVDRPQPQHPQPPARPNNPAPNQNVQTYNPPHVPPAKPAVTEENIVRSHQPAATPEVRRPVVVDPEHKAPAKPVAEIKRPEPPPPHRASPEAQETTRIAGHPEHKPEPTTVAEHEASARKPGQPALTPQQKQALEKKRLAEEKKHPEEEKPKPPQ